MDITRIWRIKILAIGIAIASCGISNAQHRHYRQNYHYYPHKAVTVIVRPNPISYINNHFNQKERLAMAMAFLETHEYLTSSQYSKITQLSKDSAEAELNAFSMDKQKPIQSVYKGKKKVYVKTNV